MSNISFNMINDSVVQVFYLCKGCSKLIVICFNCPCFLC